MLGEVPVSGRLQADVAVLELDERHALQFAKATPTMRRRRNVARDQLDRFAEIDTTAKLPRLLLDERHRRAQPRRLRRPDRQGPARGDDGPYFGIDPAVAADVPALGEADARFDDGFSPPPAGPRDGLLHPHDARTFSVRFGEEVLGPITLQQRGLAAMIEDCRCLPRPEPCWMTVVRPPSCRPSGDDLPSGRGEVIDVDGQPLELVVILAGSTVALGTYHDEPVMTMIAINYDYADGQDVSWLYDVSFESLRGHGVAITSGVRPTTWPCHWTTTRSVEVIEPDLQAALDDGHAQRGTRRVSLTVASPRWPAPPARRALRPPPSGGARASGSRRAHRAPSPARDVDLRPPASDASPCGFGGTATMPALTNTTPVYLRHPTRTCSWGGGQATGQSRVEADLAAIGDRLRGLAADGVPMLHDLRDVPDVRARVHHQRGVELPDWGSST